jgi:phosphoglucomutase
MYILYRVGGGSASNVPAGAINNITYLNAVIGCGTTLDSKQAAAVRKSITVTNPYPSVTGKDAPTVDEIKAMMENYRNNPPKELGGAKVVLQKDYESLEAVYADGKKEKLDMPTTSNVLQWFCEDGTKVSVRPSGTEPKIKFYLEVKDVMNNASEFEALRKKANERVAAIKQSLGLN